MFKKLKRNFILIAMASVTVILVIVNVVIDLTNYNRQVSSSDEIIELIEKNPRPVDPPKNDNEEPVDPKVGDSRYFIVYYNENFEFTEANMDHVDQTIISQETAITYANEIVSSKAERGYKDIYRFHFSKANEKKYQVVFLDCQRSMENYQTYFRVTLFVSLGSFAVFFLLIFFGSNIVLKPVKENYEKQNRFITNASHELKTPLTIISANNELIEIKKGSNEYSKNIEKQITRMNQMIRDLISLSKLNEKRNVDFENVNIDTFINDSLKDYKNVCIENKLEIKKHIDKDLRIIAKKDFVKQIITIILENAVKYAKSYIDISLVNSKSGVILKQSNDTHNIEDGNLNKYTERFYRDEKSRGKKEGSGIGLSLLDELAKQINAKIKIYGQNNIFNIEILFSNKNKIK